MPDPGKSCSVSARIRGGKKYRSCSEAQTNANSRCPVSVFRGLSSRWAKKTGQHSNRSLRQQWPLSHSSINDFVRPPPAFSSVQATRPALHGSSRTEESRPTATPNRCCVQLHVQLIAQSDGARIHQRGIFRRKLLSRTEAETNHFDLEDDLIALSHPQYTAITGALTQSWSQIGGASPSHSHCRRHGRAGNA